MSCSLRGSMLCMVLYLDFHGVSHQQLFEAVGTRELAHHSHLRRRHRRFLRFLGLRLGYRGGNSSSRAFGLGRSGGGGGRGFGLGFGLVLGTSLPRRLGAGGAGSGSGCGWAAGAAGGARAGAGVGAAAPTSSAGGAAAAASFVWIVSSIALFQAFIAPRSSDQPVSRRGICRS